jgi:hypothetical protein
VLMQMLQLSMLLKLKAIPIESKTGDDDISF